MNKQSIPLLSPAIGTHRELVSFHFGPADSGQKIISSRPCMLMKRRRC